MKNGQQAVSVEDLYKRFGENEVLKGVNLSADKGEAVALITQPLKNPGLGEKLPIISRTTGVFFARSTDRFARPGKIIGKVAGVEPLAGKGPNLLTS